MILGECIRIECDYGIKQSPPRTKLGLITRYANVRTRLYPVICQLKWRDQVSVRDNIEDDPEGYKICVPVLERRRPECKILLAKS
jgi:hypothetical protein